MTIKPKSLKSNPYSVIFHIAEDMLERCFSVKDTGLSSRNINELNNNDLLWEGFTNAQWRKFNFIEFVWLKIVQDLVRIGAKRKIIREVRSFLMTPVPIGFLKQIISNPAIKKQVIEKDMPEKEYFKILKELEEVPDNTVVPELCFLFFFIIQTIHDKLNYDLLINYEGLIIPYCEERLGEISQQKDYMTMLAEVKSSGYIVIPFSKIIFDFTKTHFDININLPVKYGILSEDESEIIKLVREHKLKSLTIVDSNGKSKKLIPAAAKVNAEEMVLEILMKEKYQSVSYSTKSGKTVTIDKIMGEQSS